MLVQKNPLDDIIAGDCKNILSCIPEGSIQVTITSRLTETQSIMVYMLRELGDTTGVNIK